MLGVVAVPPIEALTLVVKMLAKLKVAVAAGGDVEVSLDLVEVEAAVDAARVAVAALDLGRLCPLCLLLALVDNVVHMLLAESFVVPARACDGAALGVGRELVNTRVVHPLTPVGRVLAQLLIGKNTIPSSVLHVDVEVLALHPQHNVEVDLHLVADALLHGKRVVLLALPPPPKFRPQ